MLVHLPASSNLSTLNYKDFIINFCSSSIVNKLSLSLENSINKVLIQQAFRATWPLLPPRSSPTIYQIHHSQNTEHILSHSDTNCCEYGHIVREVRWDEEERINHATHNTQSMHKIQNQARQVLNCKCGDDEYKGIILTFQRGTKTNRHKISNH